MGRDPDSIPPIPLRDRVAHADQLIARFDAAWNASQNIQATSYATRKGVYLEFECAAGYDVKVQSLEYLPADIRLLNVRTRSEEGREIQLATVYVPKEKSRHFLKKIEAYRDKNTVSLDPAKVKPRNQLLVTSIEDIRVAVLKSFWTDDETKIPQREPRWVEVWLSSDSPKDITKFRTVVSGLGIHERETSSVLIFPERSVLLLNANQEQLLRLLLVSDQLAELRAARETCSYFYEVDNQEQAEWVEDLMKRVTFDDPSNVSVCILDNGINSGHPMISPVLSTDDLHTVKAEWGKEDHHRFGHGTSMAGISIFGDVQEAVDSNTTINVRHRLESAKILPPSGQSNPIELWGDMTAQGIFRAEVQAPYRRRVICMAVAADDTRDQGRPTSWSAMLDKLASGYDDETRRLILVSAGNIIDPLEWANYPISNSTNDVYDPAQSWNALTIGAYTNKIQISNPQLVGYNPIAQAGTLSPTSTTSISWSSRLWPIKPEIVLEGGNIATTPGGLAEEIDDLLVLSTHHKYTNKHFTLFGQTSAATAQASHLAANIYAEYPNLWPETVRGLLVHSARWTEAMKAQVPPSSGKGGYRNLLRSCGYGVPQLDIALHCLRNRLTLVSEAQLQPFKKKETTSGYGTNELHFYELPWPHEELQQLGGLEVQLRITLSYFIEPGPGEKGWKDRYRYASHGLRFDLNEPSESKEDFHKRVNAQARSEDEGSPDTSSPSSHWLLGQQRDVGSIHSDIWTGTAADLASSNFIAIRPSAGWWRERHTIGRWNRPARYALIVSIETPPINVDIYTQVASLITTPTATPVEIEIEI